MCVGMASLALSDEFVNGYDTPDMIRRIKERYWRYDGVRYVPTCKFASTQTLLVIPVGRSMPARRTSCCYVRLGSL